MARRNMSLEADRAARQIGVRHAVAEHQVDPWPRNERRELLQQRERIEEQMTCPPPRALQCGYHAAIVAPTEPVLRRRRLA